MAYGRTDLYYVYRICERFGHWIKSPDHYWHLEPETQARLLAYEVIRAEEEAVLACR